MIHRIASAGDPRLDSYRHVGDPAWIRGRGLFVAEGRLVVERLIELGRYEIVSMLLNPAARVALGDRLTAAATADVYVCDDPGFTAITGFNFHRGCLALVRRPPARDTADLLRGRALLGLEGIGNPDNVGGLFRTAAAFGVDGMLLDAATGDPFYRKAIRTSMGAVLRLPFARVDDWPAGLERFRSAGFATVALTPDPTAQPLASYARTVTARDRLLLLVGTEGSGLSDATLARADTRVRIPIVGALDSLNVTVAAGIALSVLTTPDAWSATPEWQR